MSDDEVEQPPARRAPSGRASKGNRMARLLAQEEDEAEEGDRDFYEQEFWADAEGDEEFAMDADDEQGNDSFDSDFGDSSDSDDEDEDEMSQKAEKAARATKSQKKSVYRDPKTKEAAGTASDAPKKPKKRRRSELSELTGLQPLQRGSLRASTKDATAAAQAKRRQAIELAEQRASQIAAKGGKNKGVEMRRLTQEEILAEAAQTEIINRASLEKMLRVEEEKRQVIVRVRDHTGPRVRTKSVREGDSVRTYVTFTDLPLPPSMDDVAPPYPPHVKCAVTGLTAKYFDPTTRSPYATLEAFRTLRGERRVRPIAP
mmetsp:Transcript_24408/g.74495  ORF Transcript_24408/g.74495 Transcript_24408/m.74495 type:complete len:316 (+) Transcript_24408:106-1053(+)